MKEIEEILEKHFDFWVIGCTKEHYEQSITEAIAALTARENRMVQEAKAEAYKMGLMTGGMPEFIGKPMAEDYLAQLTHRSHDDE